VSLVRSYLNHSCSSAYFSPTLICAVGFTRAIFFPQLMIGHWSPRFQPKVLDQDIEYPLCNLLLRHPDGHERVTVDSRYGRMVGRHQNGHHPTERWDYCQRLLDQAITAFQKRIETINTQKERTTHANKLRVDRKRKRTTVRKMTLDARP
jgi:hypothetical protein